MTILCGGSSALGPVLPATIKNAMQSVQAELEATMAVAERNKHDPR